MRPRRKSVTAEVVIAGVWLTACDPPTRHLVDPADAQYSGEVLKALGSPLSYLLRFGFFRLLARMKERATVPGICSHFASRKRTLKELIRTASPRQLIVLGAGLDGLGYQFANACKAIEVDVPSSQAEKRRVLSRLAPAPVQLVEGDCAAPEFEVPGDAELSDNTVAVAEGLLMYLPEQAVRALLEKVRARSKSMLASFMLLDVHGNPAFTGHQDQVDSILARVREPFQWGLHAEDVLPFFSSCGWNVVEILGAPNETLPLLKEVEGMVGGEWIAHLSAK